MIIVCVNLQVF